MRKTTKIISILLVIMTVAACSKNGQKTRMFWSHKADTLLNNGIHADYEKQIISLDFYTYKQVDVSASSNNDWIRPTVKLSNNKGELNIEVLENESISPRDGEVFLSVDGTAIDIKITQYGIPKVIIDKECYYLKADGGDIEIHIKAGVRTGGKLSARLKPANCEWTRVKNITPCGDNEYAITIGVDKNEGLGRITSIHFKIDGKTAIQDCGPCLVQNPAPFNENTAVFVKELGSLQVLMGNEVENLRRIRSLKLTGAINGLDFILLKKLFLDKAESIKQFPIEVDLSDCGIIKGNRNPFEYFGWKPSQKYEEVFYSCEIPSGVFNNALNLKHIILPDDLIIVGYHAFIGCKNLRTINIPAYVEEINSKAFFGCENLEEINLTSNMFLSTIGNQAFTTKSTLKELTIPQTVANIAPEAFLGLSVSKLHLKWLEPSEVRIVPKTEGCVLYVPKGTSELYRNTRNWSRFKDIIEE